MNSVIVNTSGKSVKKFVDQKAFMPGYDDEVDIFTLPIKSIEKQKEDWQTFKEKYKKMKNAT